MAQKHSQLVTFESVAAAAKSLVETGQRISVRQVIAEIGGGSPNAVLPLLNEWKARAAATQIKPSNINPALVDAIAREIEKAAEAAASAADTRAADAQADAEEVAQAGQHAEAKAIQLEADLQDANSKLQQQTGQLSERAAEVVQIRQEAAERIKSAEDRTERERATVEAIRQDLVRAQLQVEAIAPLQVELKELTARLVEMARALAAAEKDAAVCSAKADAATIRATDAIEQAKTLQADLAKAQERERATQETNRAEVRAVQAELSKAIDRERALQDASRTAALSVAVAADTGKASN